MEVQRIYLTGFMGAGKSTIGPILANTLGWEFYDLDRVIEKNQNKKIKEIFEEEGEEFFRKLEMNVITELAKISNAVISLGGGTIRSEQILNFLKSTGKVVYLKNSPEASYKRLRYKRDRPNLIPDQEEEPTRDELIDKITNLLETRVKYYEQAHHTINTDLYSVGKTVDKIVKIINADKS